MLAETVFCDQRRNKIELALRGSVQRFLRHKPFERDRGCRSDDRRFSIALRKFKQRKWILPSWLYTYPTPEAAEIIASKIIEKRFFWFFVFFAFCIIYWKTNSAGYKLLRRAAFYPSPCAVSHPPKSPQGSHSTVVAWLTATLSSSPGYIILLARRSHSAVGRIHVTRTKARVISAASPIRTIYICIHIGNDRTLPYGPEAI